MTSTIAKCLKTVSYVSRNMLSGSGIFPFYASYKVTSKCALKCSHCYVPREAPSADVDTVSAKEIIRNLASSSSIVLAFEGGEPFLREDIEDLLEHAKRFPVFVSVVTAYPEAASARYAGLSRFVDFLQVSIDEGHGNLHLLDRIDEIRSTWRGKVCIQSVVTARTIDRMEYKARAASEGGCKILFLPLAALYPEMKDLRPERSEFASGVRALKKKFPKTVVCSSYFLGSHARGKGCTTSSVVIDSDGSLYYPCHILKTKAFNLLDGRLDDFLLSPRARELRARMDGCSLACGWYQYFALCLKSIADLPRDVISGLERIG